MNTTMIVLFFVLWLLAFPIVMALAAGLLCTILAYLEDRAELLSNKRKEVKAPEGPSNIKVREGVQARDKITECPKCGYVWTFKG